jgi:putative ABC transport system ATP-binding protein
MNANAGLSPGPRAGSDRGGEPIELRAITVVYDTAHGRVEALRDVSLSIPAGTSVAIVGPSGCGKSTLLAIIGGLETPTSGEARIGAATVSALSDQERAEVRRRTFGFVFQADNLQPFLTVTENVGVQAVLSGRPDEPTRTEELLHALDVGQLGHRFPDQLSGGQRQRVAVARALVHQPKILLADEPTGSLDAENSVRVVELLLGLHRLSRTTLVVVTHDRSVADRMEATVEMAAGRVTAGREVAR